MQSLGIICGSLLYSPSDLLYVIFAFCGRLTLHVGVDVVLSYTIAPRTSCTLLIVQHGPVTWPTAVLGRLAYSPVPVRPDDRPSDPSSAIARCITTEARSIELGGALPFGMSLPFPSMLPRPCLEGSWECCVPSSRWITA